MLHKITRYLTCHAFRQGYGSCKRGQELGETIGTRLYTRLSHSQFVDSAAGEAGPEAVMGSRLRSQTQAVQLVRCLYPDERRDIVLVVTPEFDNTTLSDTQVLEVIANWLKKT